MLRQLRNTAIKTAVTGCVVVGTVEITTRLPSEGRSSQLYHTLSDEVVTPMMRRLLDPEDAHNLAIYSVQKGFAPRFRPNKLEISSRIDLSSTLTAFTTTGNGGRNVSLTFPSCIGLAAGFDKDGVAIQNLMHLGFGFVEIGSVTPKPQPGNPKPRSFRLVEDQAVINRFGFNSVGMHQVEQNLMEFYSKIEKEDKHDEVDKRGNGSSFINESLHLVMGVLKGAFAALFSLPSSSSQPRSLLGVNLGKNKTSTEETKDYEVGIQKLGQYADYLVINVSSPNTPGLRDLQKNEPLKRLLNAAIRERNALSVTNNNKIPPLFVKISPDITDDDIKNIATIAIQCGIDGILVTNTTNQRPHTLLSANSKETGGLSGSPLRIRSTECIRKLYHYTKGNLFIVGIGGVGSGRDAYEKLKAGASVVQIYTQMVYNGPGVVSRIRAELAEIMVENGHKSVEDVVGLDHEVIYWEKRMERTRQMRLKENVIIEE